MSSTPLHIALKKTVEDLGTDVLKSPMLVNVLADYHAFDVHDRDLQKRKRIIAEFVEKRFPDNLLRWKSYRLTYKDKCVGWINENFNKYMLDATTATLVKDVACAFLFSLGLDTDLSFDTQDNVDKSTRPNSPTKPTHKSKPSATTLTTTPDDSADALVQQLIKEHQKYKDLCQSFIHVEVDEYGLKLASVSGSYPKNILTHWNNIRYLEKKLGLPSSDFSAIRQELIDEYSSSKDEIRVVYDKLLNKYKSICDHKVAVLEMKKNGIPDYGYKPKTIRQLDKLQKKLLQLAPYLGVSNNDLNETLKQLQEKAMAEAQVKSSKSINENDNNKSNSLQETKRQYTKFVKKNIVSTVVDGQIVYKLCDYSDVLDEERNMRAKVIAASPDLDTGNLWCDNEMNKLTTETKQRFNERAQARKGASDGTEESRMVLIIFAIVVAVVVLIALVIAFPDFFGGILFILGLIGWEALTGKKK